MGKLTITFKDGEKIMRQDRVFRDDWEKYKILTDVQTIYNTDLLQQFEFDGADEAVTIDINDAKDGFVEWSKILRNVQLVEIADDFQRYNQLSWKLEQFLSRIGMAGIGDYYELDKIGNEAIRLIEAFKPSHYFSDYGSHHTAIQDIAHTLEQEIALMRNSRPTDSRKRKESLLADAQKHLIADIKSFRSSIANPQFRKVS